MLPLSFILIPAKIISFDEAVKLGLTKVEKIGIGDCGVGCVAEGKHGEKGEIVERFKIENGEHHLLFMHESRKNKLKEKGEYEKYLDHYATIEGETKKDFFKKNNLKI